MVCNDNDHGYLPICSIVFRLCKDRGICKHKINSPIDDKMRDPAHKIMEQQTAAPDKKDEKNMFCSEIHCEIYAALLHHNLPKIQKAAKSCKDGKGDRQQHVRSAL